MTVTARDGDYQPLHEFRNIARIRYLPVCVDIDFNKESREIQLWFDAKVVVKLTRWSSGEFSLDVMLEKEYDDC